MQKVLLPLALAILLCFNPAWSAGEEEEEGEKEVAKTSAYISLGEPMVLNLSNDNKRLTFLQLKADILVQDSNSEALIKPHVPAIRHELIVLLSEQKVRDMKSSTNREEIRKIASTQIQALIADLTGSNDASDVLFSSFLVQ